jgi:HEAT repeat protein
MLDMLDQAFEALKTYDWGQDRKVLNPIDETIVATSGDDDARGELEARLAEVLKTDVSRDAKQFVCRKLMVIGTAASVPVLATLLNDPELSHMARYALERIPGPEAAKAMQNAVPKLSVPQKVGVISSLGVRGEDASVKPLTAMLGDGDATVARAAALALGAIRTSAAAKALARCKPSDATKAAVTDSSLACAEQLVADGNKAEALTIYKRFAGEDQPKHVRLAATRGMLACAGK